MYTPVNPNFTVQKWGLRGSKSYRYVFVMFGIRFVMICSLPHQKIVSADHANAVLLLQLFICVSVITTVPLHLAFVYSSSLLLSLPVLRITKCLFKYTENFIPKTENFQIKTCDIFHISAQNIDCGYSLEPPR